MQTAGKTLRRRKMVPTAKKGMKGGDCGTTDYGTFQPTTSDTGFVYGLPTTDIGGATAVSANGTINAASQIAASVAPMVPSYAVVDFGQGENDPISPAGAEFVGGAKKGKKRKATGKKTKAKAKKGAKKVKKIAGKKTTSVGKVVWTLTEFKVKITNSEGKKVVKSLFFNATTGEYRLRKMIKKGRKKVARFTAIPKAAEFVR